MLDSTGLKRIVLRGNYYLLRKYMVLTRNTPDVKNSIETVNYILKTGCSVARFGDGEFYWIFQNRAEGNFEKNSEELSNSLKKVLDSNLSNLIVCIPNIFSNLNGLKPGAQHFWEKYLFKEGIPTLRLLNKNHQYYDTQFTRPYMDYKTTSKDFTKYFNLLKSVWQDKDILMVEGEKSRFGVNSDILDKAKSVHRIICPSINAFESYTQIMKKVNLHLRFIKNPIVLISLGPTATILSYDLAQQNIQAIDIGHLDVEYQWFKLGATNKVGILGKYVNEAPKKFIGELPEDILKKYRTEIIDIVK